MTSVIDVILLLLVMTSLRCIGVNLNARTIENNELCKVINLRQFQLDPDIEITQIACRDATSMFVPASNMTVVTNTLAPPAEGLVTSCSNITVSWNLPDGEYGITLSQLNFFEIRLTPYNRSSLDQSGHSNNLQQCLHYKPIYKQPTTSSRQQFRYTVIVPPKSIYFVQLFTFPTVAAAVGSWFLVPQSLVSISAAWNNEKVNVVVRNDSCSRSATVTLQFLPMVAGYRILVVDKLDRTVNETWMPANQTSHHGVAVFKNLPIGNYSVKILPCRYYQNGNSNYVQGNACSRDVTVSAEFCICPVDLKRDCTLKGPPVMTLQQIIAVVCGIISAFLLTTLSVCVYKCLKMMRPLRQTRTKVLLIYIQDDHLHKNVIERLHAFLEKYCNLDITAEFTTDQRIIALSRTTFVLESFERADMALVVISDGLRQRWHHMGHGSATTSNRDVGTSTNDLLLNYLRQRMICDVRYDILHSVVFARFDYTTASPRQDEQISYRKEIHLLMRDINNMVYSLHGINIHTRRTFFWFLPTWYGMTSRYSAEGHELLAAIKCVTDRKSSAAVAESDALLRCESPTLKTEPALFVVPVSTTEQLPTDEDLYSRSPETTNVTSGGETSGFYSDDYQLHLAQNSEPQYSELSASLVSVYRDQCTDEMVVEPSPDCEIDYEYFIQLNCEYDTS